jgi:hypothetical protein
VAREPAIQDYPQYIQVTYRLPTSIRRARQKAVAGKLWFVANGVGNWYVGGEKKMVWNFIECSYP